jgi:hypothetical protein
MEELYDSLLEAWPASAHRATAFSHRPFDQCSSRFARLRSGFFDHHSHEQTHKHSKEKLFMTTMQQANATITIPSATDPEQALNALDDIDFENQEQAGKPIIEEARLWWFNGLPTDTDLSAIGWHVKAGINPYIDETMEGMGIQRYMVQHKLPDRTGSNDPKPYWRLRTCSLVIVAQRLQSSLEMDHTLADRHGIAYAWRTITDAQGTPKLHEEGKNKGKVKKGTMLKFRAYIHEMYRHGYYDWMPCTISGFETDELLKTLQEQYRVLEFYSTLRKGQGKNPVAPFYLFSIPVGPGSLKQAGDQGTIYPIVAQIPTSIDSAYLREHVIDRGLIDQIRDGLLVDTVTWSQEESGRIAAGRNQGEPLALPGGTSSSAPALNSPLSQQVQNDPLVEQPQLTWIVRTFCGGDEQKVQKICQDFGVSSPNQLHMSHFRTLVSQTQSPVQSGQH